MKYLIDHNLSFINSNQIDKVISVKDKALLCNGKSSNKLIRDYYIIKLL